jgi:hypothetical protein
MSLLCSLGWHSPAGVPRWNDGFYFSTCSRCRRDLVRTAFERWHVPKGFRVVWSQASPTPRLKPDLRHASAAMSPIPAPAQELPAEAGVPVEAAAVPAADSAPFEPRGRETESGDETQPPEEAEWDFQIERGREAEVGEETFEFQPPASPDFEPGARIQSGFGPAGLTEESESHLPGTLPIQALIDQLGDEEASESAPVPPPPPPVPPRKPSWDFMDDEPAELAGNTANPSATRDVPPTGMPIPRMTDREQSQRSSGFAGLVRRSREILDGATEPWKSLALAAVIGMIVIAAVYVWGSAEPASDTIDAPAEVASWASPGVPAGSQPDRPARAVAYVTASVLSCRSAPAEEGQRLRNLERGDAVELIAHAPPWASLSYRGRQCWALERYLSPIKPY